MFDRVARDVSTQVARAWFFSFCCLIIILWVPLILFMDVNTWQLIINTVTTVLTFLLVALLHNDQQQFESVVLERLSAIQEQLNG